VLCSCLCMKCICEVFVRSVCVGSVSVERESVCVCEVSVCRLYISHLCCTHRYLLLIHPLAIRRSPNSNWLFVCGRCSSLLWCVCVCAWLTTLTFMFRAVMSFVFTWFNSLFSACGVRVRCCCAFHSLIHSLNSLLPSPSLSSVVNVFKTWISDFFEDWTHNPILLYRLAIWLHSSKETLQHSLSKQLRALILSKVCFSGFD
jgi:hypothetical protein